jgi:hypothetical protein
LKLVFFQKNWVETRPNSELLVDTHPLLDKTLQFPKQVTMIFKTHNDILQKEKIKHNKKNFTTKFKIA